MIKLIDMPLFSFASAIVSINRDFFIEQRG